MKATTFATRLERAFQVIRLGAFAISGTVFPFIAFALGGPIPAVLVFTAVAISAYNSWMRTALWIESREMEMSRTRELTNISQSLKR